MIHTSFRPSSHLSGWSRIAWIFTSVLLLIGTALVGCSKSDDDSTVQTQSAQPNSEKVARDTSGVVATGDNVVELLFVYGSEKQKWIEDVTPPFNAAQNKLPSGKVIQVRAVAAGSGESKDDILSGHVKAHLWSPASGVFVKLGNAESQAKGGPLLGSTQELVLSPVVIAMWKPMAEALGWPDKPIGWSDVIALAKDPQGWKTYGHPEFGSFKFGHTHPEYSNSGLISILAEAYAGAGKVRGVTMDDVRDPKVEQYVDDIEKAVVHYGRSTGFFGRRLIEDGPQYLSAAVLYENMVVESYAKNLSVPLVAIYPKEGTIWSDHPIGIVQRDWVTDEHKKAAEVYIDYLRQPAQQTKAMTYGFRPAVGDLAAPMDKAHGVDPLEPKTILELPSAETTQGIIELWRKHKKHSSVVLVFDTSGSMNDDQKMVNAQAGAQELVNMLGDEDTLALVPFNATVTVTDYVNLGTGRGQLTNRIRSLFPDGGTHLYEAIAAAHNYVKSKPDPNRITAIVVLTDGEDNGQTITLNQVLEQTRSDPERRDIRVFTIGYGKSARLDDIKRIAEKSRGEFYEGKPENIRSVFRDIATFF